jgi:hypothetical protein
MDGAAKMPLIMVGTCVGGRVIEVIWGIMFVLDGKPILQGFYVSWGVIIIGTVKLSISMGKARILPTFGIVSENAGGKSNPCGQIEPAIKWNASDFTTLMRNYG